jgi:hypothetical protein
MTWIKGSRRVCENVKPGGGGEKIWDFENYRTKDQTYFCIVLDKDAIYQP